MLLELLGRAGGVLVAAGFLADVVVALGSLLDARFFKYQVILVWVDCADGCTGISLFPLFTFS